MEKSGSKLFPVDSEHSAIWQCLIGEKIEDVKRIILTGSGGPFRTRDVKTFPEISLQGFYPKQRLYQMLSVLCLVIPLVLIKGFLLHPTESYNPKLDMRHK